ncbi:MAG: S41 family peptidase [Clostridium sp.]|uniref:S41 family peptidase n=1 Tax=Clostridium sp. TaxID=1506 RepID=UPI003216F9EA
MNKKLKILLVIIISIFLIVGGIYGYKRYKKYDTYKTDAVFLLNFLEDNYPFFQVKEKTLDYNFLDQKEKLIEKISKSKNDTEFIKNVSLTMRLLQNAHSSISFNSLIFDHSNLNDSNIDLKEKTEYWTDKYSKTLYIADVKCKYIQGKYIVTKSKNEKVPVGSMITKINGKSVSDYLYEHKEIYYVLKDSKRNQYYIHEDNYFKRDSSPDSIEVEYNDEKIDSTIHYDPYSKEIKEWYYGDFINSSDNNITLDIVDAGKTAYIKIRSFNNEYMAKNQATIQKFLLNECADVDNIIIDIRGNGGGNNQFGEFLISALSDKPLYMSYYDCFKDTKFMDEYYFSRMLSEKEINKSEIPNSNYDLNNFRIYNVDKTITPYGNSIKFKGDIYILVDDIVYSASEYFASIIKDTKFAEIIGTTTGGDGLGPEPIATLLPNSKIAIQFSSTLSMNSVGIVNEEVHTEPDIYIEQDLNDYLEYLNSDLDNIERSKYDTVYNRVMNILK